MLNIQSATKREIDEFLKEDFSKRGNADSVILCGSQATGNATERSDIDLCYIGEMTAFSRESLF
ncbi:MAG: nucleotidyltransferase domain-containing protein [Bacilli bacterium]